MDNFSHVLVALEYDEMIPSAEVFAVLYATKRCDMGEGQQMVVVDFCQQKVRGGFRWVAVCFVMIMIKSMQVVSCPYGMIYDPMISNRREKSEERREKRDRAESDSLWIEEDEAISRGLLRIHSTWVYLLPPAPP